MSSYATLSETLIADILDVWIPDSAAGSLDRPQIRLLPHRILIHKKTPCKSTGSKD